MSGEDWVSVLDQAARLDTGFVQFIGGEPTLHPALPDLIAHALALQLEVEVFSNLVQVNSVLWDVFARPGVRLATSYYSLEASEHEAITGQAVTRVPATTLSRRLERGIPIRVGIIGMAEDQQVYEAESELKAFGVTEVGVDWLRQAGRGVRDEQAGVEQLCFGQPCDLAHGGSVAMCILPLDPPG